MPPTLLCRIMSCPTSSLSSAHSRWLVWLVAGAFFMEFLDAMVITTALPQMALSFHTEAVTLSTGVSAYMLALAVFIPLSGWMADRFGARQVFSAAILIFTLASLLCSLSGDLWSFSAARVLQGLGGAMMVPVGRIVVLRATPREGLVKAIAALTWPALTAPLIGPALGGFITMHWSWRWIFLLNLPLGLIGFLLTLFLVHGAAGVRRPFDRAGFILSGLGCSGLMFACDLASHTPFNGVLVAVFGLAGMLAMALVARHLQRCAHPLVDLSALAIPTFAVAMWGGSLFRMAINSAPFLLPLMFQLAFGLDAGTSGMLLLALFAGNLCMKPATGWIMRSWGFRRVLLFNGVLVALGFVGCALLTAATPELLLLILLFFCGLCRSMQFTCFNTINFCDVKAEQMNGASTLSSIFLQMSAGFGVALAAMVLKAAAVWFPGGAHALALIDFRIAFMVMALISLLALFDTRRLPHDAGAHLSGQQSKGV
jgi:EmrB/QacA subfamily drug resistance transporter